MNQPDVTHEHYCPMCEDTFECLECSSDEYKKLCESCINRIDFKVDATADNQGPLRHFGPDGIER